MIFLITNGAPLIVYLASLGIQLGSNRVSLIVHLIATVARIILIEPCIISMVATVTLIIPPINVTTVVAIASLSRLVILIIDLGTHGIALIVHLIATIAIIILIVPPVVPLVATVALIAPYINVATIVAHASLIVLIIDLCVTTIERIPCSGITPVILIPFIRRLGSERWCLFGVEAANACFEEASAGDMLLSQSSIAIIELKAVSITFFLTKAVIMLSTILHT
ncbi:hypothetical protein [Ktedonospora formicarum]|uniref:hypothetical protein n=1 Tax=Ktedonospora formicarum TaxID=2778364 RepID=UPI001C69257B|nr:hypothetical protein [Ktedonospora formicarum]